MIGRLLDWLNSGSDRRSAPREAGEGLRAFYWDGDVPHAHAVKDISRHGAYVETDSISWPRGTRMILTLQIDPNGARGGTPPEAIAVQAEIVRTSASGIGIKFVFPAVDDRRKLLQFLSNWKPTPASANGASKALGASSRQGQSLTEFAFIFPLLFLLVVNVVNFGTFMYAWITVANAARAGSQYWVTGGATVFAPSTPTEAQVAAVVTKDANSLPNRASLEVEACTNDNGTVKCAGSYKTVTPPADPEATSYVSATIDVKYTYQPAIPLWPVPGLNIHATLPSTTIHRQTVMRVMN